LASQIVHAGKAIQSNEVCKADLTNLASHGGQAVKAVRAGKASKAGRAVKE